MSETETATAPDEGYRKAGVYYGRELYFNERAHRYEWDGKFVPGVTTILRRLNKPALIQWAASATCDHIRAHGDYDPDSGGWFVSEELLDAARVAHAAVRDTAADIGTEVHKYAAAVLAGQPVDISEDDRVRSGIAAFEDWLKEHKIEPLAVERRVLSKKFFYAGTTDFFGRIDGAYAVLDFKTSSAIYDEMWLQTAAYELALQEELQLEEPITRWLIRLDKKTGRFETRSQPYSALHEDAWINLVELNKCLTKIEEQRKLANGIRTKRPRPRKQ